MGGIAITLEELELRQIKSKLLDKRGPQDNCMFCDHLRPDYKTQRVSTLNRTCCKNKLPYSILGKDGDSLALNTFLLTAGAICEDYR